MQFWAADTPLWPSLLGETYLYGCGDGRRGQLGPHFTCSLIFRGISCDHFNGGDIKVIAAAWETSFVVIGFPDGDILFSVGADDFGELGVGGLSSGRKETSDWQSVDLKHLFPPEATELRILRLKSGPRHVLLQLNAQVNGRNVDRLAGWGASRHGQLDTTPNDNPPMRYKAFATLPRKISLDCILSDFSVGNQHTVFLTEEGSVIAFGSNRKGQTENLRDAPHRITEVFTTWNGTYLVQIDKENYENWAIWATGSNSHCQLGEQSSASNSTVGLRRVNFGIIGRSRIVKLACGSEHVLVAIQKIGDDQTHWGPLELYGWGWNEHGNLGLNHTNDVSTPCRIVPNVDVEGEVIGVWAGCATSWIAVRTGG